MRIIAATSTSITGRARTHTPITYAHATIAPGATLSVPWPADYNALVYVLSGSTAASAPQRRPVRTGQLALFGAGDR